MINKIWATEAKLTWSYHSLPDGIFYSILWNMTGLYWKLFVMYFLFWSSKIFLQGLFKTCRDHCGSLTAICLVMCITQFMKHSVNDSPLSRALSTASTDRDPLLSCIYLICQCFCEDSVLVTVGCVSVCIQKPQFLLFIIDNLESSQKARGLFCYSRWHHITE